jgi:predicted lipoprotein with Yx(FWY)xxD motif
MKQMIFVLVSMMISAAAFAQSPVAQVTLDDGRTILTNAEGLSLYTFDVDDGSVSNCYNGCAKAWPPVLVKSGEGLQAPLATTTRKDGTLQVTVNGQPVYLFVGDSRQGDIKGDGLDDVWHLIVVQ